MHLSSSSHISKSAKAISVNYQMLLLWIVCVSWYFGFIIMLILFITGTRKSTDERKLTSANKFPCCNTGCPSRLLLWIAFILFSIAVFSKSVDGVTETDSRNNAVLLGDRIELDCTFNTSLPLEWHVTSYGSNVSEAINGSSVSDPYEVVSEHLGHANLIIDQVRTSLAGKYECSDTDKLVYKLTVDVTVVAQNPICDQNAESSPIVCRFPYAGNKAPDFKWSTPENTTSCTQSVSSTIGSLQLKGYKRFSNLSRWQCKPEEDNRYDLGQVIDPQNYAAVKDEIIRLNCSKRNDDTGLWFRSAPLSSNQILLYHRKVTRSGLFSVDESIPGRSDLLFISSNRTSGKYGCDSVYATHTAEVIVLEPQPICLWETIGRVVNANCSIGFSGNWPPVLVWSDVTGTLKANDTNIIPSQRVTSLLSVLLTGDPSELYLVKCTVSFREKERPKETTARNIPKLALDTCRVEIEAPGSGSVVGKKGVQKSNFEPDAEYSAVHSETVDEHKQKETRYRIALLGDKVELDCFTDTSSPLEWYFKNGSNEREFINGSSQADSNVTDAYRIVSETFGQETLVIDHVLLKHAGKYECNDGDKKYKLSVELTVVDPIPTCNQIPENSAIICPFHFAGNMAPDLQWLTLDNSTFCNDFVHDSSTIGSLRIKNYKNSNGPWRCEPKENDGHALAELFSPLNYAAVKGAKVRLNCSTQNDYNRYWFRSEPLSTEKMLIHHRKMTTNDLFVVDESVPGRLDLLFHLRDETSGRFGCDSVHGTHTAEIILADSPPTCSSGAKDGVVIANCSIDFSGNWHPVIHWTEDNDRLLKADNEITIPGQRVTSSLNVPLSGDHHEVHYIVCTVTFSIKDKPLETTAMNIPQISPNFCRATIEAPADPGAAAGAIDVDQSENIDSGPGADKKGAPKGNEGKPIAEVHNQSSGSGRGRESLVLLQEFLTLVAAFLGLAQF